MNARALPAPKHLSKTELLVGLALDGDDHTPHADLGAATKRAAATGDLETEFRATSAFHVDPKAVVRRIVFVGLGKKKDLTTERLRQVAAVAQARAEAAKVPAFALVVRAEHHAGIDAATPGRAIAEGLWLGAYRYRGAEQEQAEAAPRAEVRRALRGEAAARVPRRVPARSGRAPRDGLRPRHGEPAAEPLHAELDGQEARKLAGAAIRSACSSGATWSACAWGRCSA
jgi:hypothetical protein